MLQFSTLIKGKKWAEVDDEAAASSLEWVPPSQTQRRRKEVAVVIHDLGEPGKVKIANEISEEGVDRWSTASEDSDEQYTPGPSLSQEY